MENNKGNIILYQTTDGTSNIGVTLANISNKKTINTYIIKK